MSARRSDRFAKPRLERLEGRELPAAGLLDPSFGAGGLVTTPPVGSPASTVLVQPDGKIVVGTRSVMAATAAGFGPLEVLRYNANGAPDLGFGDHGKALVPLAPQGGGVVDSLLLQPDGKIVVAAFDSGGPGLPTQALVRLTRGGQVDPTFGTRGAASEQIDGHSFLIAQVFPQTGGKLAAVVLIVKPDRQLLRYATMHYTADGRPDPAFGDGGLVVFPDTINFREVQGGTILPDGKVVLAGVDSDSPGSNKVTVSRFDAHGSPDRTFARSGSETVTNPGSLEHPWRVDDVTAQPDGKILLTSGIAGFSVLRLDADGSPDAGFGVGGFATIASPNWSLGQGSAVVVQSDGKILLGGRDDDLRSAIRDSSVLVRLTAAGLPDPSFGANGVVVTAFPNPSLTGSSIEALAIQPDGKAVAVGTYESPQGDELALARYQTAAPKPATVASSTTLSASPAVRRSVLTLTATVTAAHGVPTGSITFFDGTIVVGAAAVGPGGIATLSIYDLGDGTHHFAAHYSGDASRAASSASATVVASNGSTSLSLSASPSYGGGVAIVATVSPALGGGFPLTGTVSFYEGNRLLGRAPVGPPVTPFLYFLATFTLPRLSPGSHTITARYGDDPNYLGSTSVVAVGF